MAEQLVRLVTIPEAARRIGFPASRVFQQVQYGNVTAYRVAGEVIVLRAEDVELVRDLVVTTLRNGRIGPAPRLTTWEPQPAAAS